MLSQQIRNQNTELELSKVKLTFKYLDVLYKYQVRAPLKPDHRSHTAHSSSATKPLRQQPGKPPHTVFPYIIIVYLYSHLCTALHPALLHCIAQLYTRAVLLAPTNKLLNARVLDKEATQTIHSCQCFNPTNTSRIAGNVDSHC